MTITATTFTKKTAKIVMTVVASKPEPAVAPDGITDSSSVLTPPADETVVEGVTQTEITDTGVKETEQTPEAEVQQNDTEVKENEQMPETNEEPKNAEAQQGDQTSETEVKVEQVEEIPETDVKAEQASETEAKVEQVEEAPVAEATAEK